MTAGSIWKDPAMDKRLRQLHAEGHSMAEIGKRMGLSKNQVVGRAHRLKLPKRELPAALQSVKDKPRVRVSARLGAGGEGASRLAPSAHLSLVKAGLASSGPRAVATSAQGVSSLLQTSAAGASQPRVQIFSGRGCQYPLWPDRVRVAFDEARYCDAPARRNEEGRQDSAYCPEHHAKCFRPFEKKVAA